MLETNRLILRGFKMEDKDACFEFLSDEQTCLDDGGYHAFLSQDEEFLQLMKDLEQHKNRYMIVLKDTNQVIGTINLREADRGVKAFEFGYIISPLHRRKGYAYEALRCVINYHFTHTDVLMFTACCFVHNIASRKLLEKLGFIYEGFERKGSYHAEYGPIDVLRYFFEK